MKRFSRNFLNFSYGCQRVLVFFPCMKDICGVYIESHYIGMVCYQPILLMVLDWLTKGFECYRVPLAKDEYVREKLQEKAQLIVEDAEKTVRVLSGDRQALWTMLRLSVSRKFDYFCQLSPPSLNESVAKRLESELWRVLRGGYRSVNS